MKKFNLAMDPEKRKAWQIASTLRSTRIPRIPGERRSYVRQSEFLKGLALGLVGGGLIGFILGLTT